MKSSGLNYSKYKKSKKWYWSSYKGVRTFRIRKKTPHIRCVLKRKVHVSNSWIFQWKWRDFKTSCLHRGLYQILWKSWWKSRFIRRQTKQCLLFQLNPNNIASYLDCKGFLPFFRRRALYVSWWHFSILSLAFIFISLWGLELSQFAF